MAFPHTQNVQVHIHIGKRVLSLNSMLSEVKATCTFKYKSITNPSFNNAFVLYLANGTLYQQNLFVPPCSFCRIGRHIVGHYLFKGKLKYAYIAHVGAHSDWSKCTVSEAYSARQGFLKCPLCFCSFYIYAGKYFKNINNQTLSSNLN